MEPQKEPFGIKDGTQGVAKVFTSDANGVGAGKRHLQMLLLLILVRE
ncbi:hypothetical protein ACFFWB_27130 [Flavobacterium procerum]